MALEDGQWEVEQDGDHYHTEHGEPLVRLCRFITVIALGYYDGNGVTQDGLIVTSGTCPYRASFIDPDTTTELTTRFIKLLNSQTPGDGEQAQDG